jgi:hypothetical protein
MENQASRGADKHRQTWPKVAASPLIFSLIFPLTDRILKKSCRLYSRRRMDIKCRPDTLVISGCY